jgi:PGM1 C-terminal domain
MTGHPVFVRSRPEPSAHPSAEAWPLTGRRRIVVVPSRALDRWHEPAAETQAYEERLLSFLLELRDPHLEITFVSSMPIASATVDYHLSMLSAATQSSARRRLDLVAVGDADARPLSERLLERGSVLAQIRRTIPASRQAWLIPYNSTAAEQDVAHALAISVYGSDPAHEHLGTKSGARALFARAGVCHPLGAEHVRSITDAVRAIGRLRDVKPELSQLIVKLDRGVSGEGNAIIDLADLPAPRTVGVDRLVEGRVRAAVPEVASVSAADFLDKLAAQGGVLEERITGIEIRSPSVQLHITPGGRVEVIATHDQILGGRSGQQYLGCRFPADPAYAVAISVLAQRMAERLAAVGVIGRLGIDFVVARQPGWRWQPFAVELNLRMGGTTHPQQTLVCLTGGAYDAERATFITPSGEPRHYVANDHLETPELGRLGADGLLAAARRQRLTWDGQRGTGAVFHMLGSVGQLGRAGVTAIAETAEAADSIYRSVEATLNQAGRRRLLSPSSRGRAAA